MPIVVTFTSDPKLVMRSYRAAHQWAFLFRCGASVVTVLLGVSTRSIGVTALGVAVFVIGEVAVRRQLRPFLQGVRQVTLTMTDNEYKTEGPDRSTSRTWSTFNRAKRVGDFWVLRVSTAAALAFPASALNESQTEAFKSLLRAKGLLAK